MQVHPCQLLQYILEFNPLRLFVIRSAVYSDRFRTCRLSRYNQKDGMRIIYDADYDYYENLMRKNNRYLANCNGNDGLFFDFS